MSKNVKIDLAQLAQVLFNEMDLKRVKIDPIENGLEMSNEDLGIFISYWKNANNGYVGSEELKIMRVYDFAIQSGYEILSAKKVDGEIHLNYAFSHPLLIIDTFTNLNNEQERFACNSNFLYNCLNLALNKKEKVSPNYQIIEDTWNPDIVSFPYSKEKTNLGDIARFFLQRFTDKQYPQNSHYAPEPITTLHPSNLHSHS